MSHAELTTQEARLARRSVARAVIIEAGRRLALRDGVGELSLSAVAAEAGFNPSTVFGHFRNKDELLLAIVAQDLGALAALMRASSPDARSTDTDALSPLLPEETHVAPLSISKPQDEGGSGLEAESKPSEGPEPVATRDEERAISRESAQRPAVDLWLERRLRIFERGLADLDSRLKDTEPAAARALALSEQTVKAVFDRFEAFEHEQREAAQSLTARMEETERRQRGATAEMRAAVNDAATRIEILEASRRADHDTARKSEGIPEEHPSSAQTATPSPEPTEIAEQEGYHAAAQRAASAAALLAGMRDRAEKTDALGSRHSKKVQLYRKHYLLGACLVLLAFAVGAFVAFYAGQARGRQLAISPGATLNHVSTRVSQVAPTHAAARNSGTAASPDPRARLAAFAQAGNANAEFLLGLGFLHGDGVAPDQAEGARWIRLAAEQHDPIAQYYLGALYEHGNGVNRDGTEAMRWYQSAAMQGNRKAMHALGIAYAQGEGIRKDYTEAARWFSKAAEHGLVNSQFNLAVLYERGLGVRQSLLDAYKWYAIAAASGDQESRKRLDALKTQLGADDLAAGERAARAFAPKNENEAANNPPALADLLSRQSH